MDENTLKQNIDKARRLKRDVTQGDWDWGACGLEAYVPDMNGEDGALVLETDDVCVNPTDAEAMAAIPVLLDTVCALADRLAAAEYEAARLRKLFQVTG